VELLVLPWSVKTIDEHVETTAESLSTLAFRETAYVNLDGCLTVHHSITLVDLQLDAQNVLFIYI
jgi:hypothetical protein